MNNTALIADHTPVAYDRLPPMPPPPGAAVSYSHDRLERSRATYSRVASILGGRRLTDDLLDAALRRQTGHYTRLGFTIRQQLLRRGMGPNVVQVTLRELAFSTKVLASQRQQPTMRPSTNHSNVPPAPVLPAYVPPTPVLPAYVPPTQAMAAYLARAHAMPAYAAYPTPAQVPSSSLAVTPTAPPNHAPKKTLRPISQLPRRGPAANKDKRLYYDRSGAPIGRSVHNKSVVDSETGGVVLLPEERDEFFGPGRLPLGYMLGSTWQCNQERFRQGYGPRRR